MKPSKHVWAFKCSDHRAQANTYSRPACILMNFFLFTSLSHYYSYYHFTNRIGVYNLLRFARKIDWEEAKREVKRKTTLGKTVRVLLFYRTCVLCSSSSRHESLQNMIGNIERHAFGVWLSEWVRSKEGRGKKAIKPPHIRQMYIGIAPMVDRLKSLTC